jgi:hypothetical protein
MYSSTGNLGTGQVECLASRHDRFIPWTVFLLPFQMGGWVGGPRRFSGHFGEYVSLFPPPGIEPRFLGRPGQHSSLVTITTELTRPPAGHVKLI